MLGARLLLIIGFILLIGGLAFFALAQTADATYKDACGPDEANYRKARAARIYREACYVENKTDYYSGLYGTAVGRWVWLARDVGWPKAAIPSLMAIVHRESAGNPLAKNPTSSASGLLQFLSDWWYGKWNPFDPRANLRHGYLAWQKVRFAPWAL